MNPTHTVSVRTLQILIDSVVEAGVSRASFLSAGKIDRSSLESLDSRLPQRKLFELFGLALELTGDPAFGLHSIERVQDDALNPLAAMVAHAPTLRDALRSIQEFRSLRGDDASFGVYEDGGKLTLRCSRLADEPIFVRRFVAEIVLGGLFRLIERFRGVSQIECVAFDYAAPDYRHEYARVFKGRARFEQPFTELRCAAELMTAASPHADPELHETLRIFSRRRLAHLSEGLPYSERVRDLLTWQRPPRDMTMANVARRLGLSVRSLRRHLTAEGKAYPELVNEALASIAKTCLCDERRSIWQTAVELGFSDNTSFHRAFKRWTGLTPFEYRQRELAVSGHKIDACRSDLD